MPQPKSTARRSTSGRSPRPSRRPAPGAAAKRASGARRRGEAGFRRQAPRGEAAQADADAGRRPRPRAADEGRHAHRRPHPGGVDDAVRRGRMTRSDAEDLVQRADHARAQADRGPHRGHRAAARPLGGARAGDARAASAGAAIASCARSTGRAARWASARSRSSATTTERRRRSPSALDDLTPAQLRKVRDHERRNANRKSVLHAIDALLKASTVSHGAQPQPRPLRGAELDLRIDALAFGGNGVARLDGYVVFVHGAVPGDRVRAVRHEAQAGLRRGAHDRGARARARAHRPRSPTTRARRGRCSPTSASSRSRPSRSTTRCGASASSTATSSSRSSPPSSSGATATSSSTPSAPTTTATLVCGFHAPGLVGGDRRRSRTACCRPSAATRPAARCSPGAARRASRPTTAARRPACCATSSSARAGAPARSRCASSPSPGELDVERFAEAVARATALLWTRVDGRRRDDRRAATELLSRRRDDRRGARRPAASRSRPTRSSRRTPRWPSASTASRPSTPRSQGWERVYDLFCGIGTIGLSLAPRAGELWGMEIVEEAVADAIDNARAERDRRTRSFFAGDVRLALRELVEQAGRPDVLVVDPPRAGLSAEGRAPHHRGRARSASSTSPATRRRSRPTPRSSSRRATRCGACGRSTCSRRPRTSSASRCWSAAWVGPACFSSKIAAIIVEGRPARSAWTPACRRCRGTRLPCAPWPRCRRARRRSACTPRPRHGALVLEERDRGAQRRPARGGAGRPGSGRPWPRSMAAGVVRIARSSSPGLLRGGLLVGPLGGEALRDGPALAGGDHEHPDERGGVGEGGPLFGVEVGLLRHRWSLAHGRRATISP